MIQPTAAQQFAGPFGINHAGAFAELDDYQSHAAYFIALASDNGQGLQSSYKTLPLTLEAGNYRLTYGTISSNGNPQTYGSSLNGYGASYQYADGIAELYGITPVPTPSVQPVPVPVRWSCRRSCSG